MNRSFLIAMILVSLSSRPAGADEKYAHSEHPSPRHPKALDQSSYMLSTTETVAKLAD